MFWILWNAYWVVYCGDPDHEEGICSGGLV